MGKSTRSLVILAQCGLQVDLTVDLTSWSTQKIKLKTKLAWSTGELAGSTRLHAWIVLIGQFLAFGENVFSPRPVFGTWHDKWWWTKWEVTLVKKLLVLKQRSVGHDSFFFWFWHVPYLEELGFMVSPSLFWGGGIPISTSIVIGAFKPYKNHCLRLGLKTTIISKIIGTNLETKFLKFRPLPWPTKLRFKTGVFEHVPFIRRSWEKQCSRDSNAWPKHLQAASRER